ncbi:MAG: class I SAM-dependent methyltransferase [Solirubrobacterales bacterium]
MADTNAQIYADHRPRYPQKLIDDLRSHTVGDRGELLIDWGCGTGEVTLPLSRYFERVIAIDVNSEFVALGQDKARRENIENVVWHVDQAENIQIADESCDLITSASAFHWMDRELLSERAFRGLRQDGALALVGGAGTNIWNGAVEWHKVAVECLSKYLGEQRPPEVNRDGAAKKRHDSFLATAGFEIEKFRYPTEFSWPVDKVAGYMYTIAGGLPWSHGDRRADFEREFSEALARLNPSGVVHETINFFLLIASKP